MAWWVGVALLVCFSSVNCGGHNLSCYQCKKGVNEECGPESLLPCASNFDRCVTHISKDEQRGYLIKRECGLGPCAFEDDMVNRGLGLDACDRSKDDYFCVFCCRTSGCNKSDATHKKISPWLMGLFVIANLQIWFI